MIVVAVRDDGAQIVSDRGMFFLITEGTVREVLPSVVLARGGWEEPRLGAAVESFAVPVIAALQPQDLYGRRRAALVALVAAVGKAAGKK